MAVNQSKANDPGYLERSAESGTDFDIRRMDPESMNKELEKRVAAFKGEHDHSAVPGIARQLEQLLYGAIETSPEEVNAVQITCAPDFSRQIHPDWGRNLLSAYVRLLNGDTTTYQNLEGVVPLNLTVHLPFRNSPAFQYTHKTIEFGIEHPTFSRQPVLYLNICGSDWSYGKVTFAADEIQSVKLAQVEDSEFSPLFDYCERPLRKSWTALSHFLAFNDFINTCPTNSEVGIKLDEGTRSQLNRIRTPHMDNRALAFFPYDGELTGFAVFLAESGTELYEFNRLELPTHTSSYSVAALCGIQMYENEHRDNITVYKGDRKIIARLHEVTSKKSQREYNFSLHDIFLN